jgi:hypothetical protein
MPQTVNQPSAAMNHFLCCAPSFLNQQKIQIKREDKIMSVIKLGSPAIPVKITETGTCLAKLEHVWQAARRYARQNGYKVVETYGVMGVAPF